MNELEPNAQQQWLWFGAALLAMTVIAMVAATSGRRLKLWREVKAKNPKSGQKMSDAIFIANKASGHLAIGDKKEMDKATWRKPRGIRLTPTSRYIRDKLFPKRG